VTERSEQEQDDYENDPWLYQFLAGQREREHKQRALAIGCLVPLILIPVLIVLMVIGN